jgi:hypothetical protein
VRDEKIVSDILHDNPSASKSEISSVTELPPSAEWHTVRDSQLYPFYVQPECSSLGTNISVPK